MIMAIKVLIALRRVSSQFIWPLEKWFVLNLFQNLTDRFSKHHINHLGVDRPWLSYIIPFRPIVIVLVRPKIPHLLRDNLSLPFSLQLVVFNPFVLTLSISWRKLVTGLPVKDFLKPCSTGRPTLKVLKVTSSKSPSISLNISQYLSEYAFTDSPSLIDMDNKEFRGWGILLHMINREQND